LVIYITLIHELARYLSINEIEESIENEFKFPVKRNTLQVSTETFYDKGRKQYHSTSILKMLLNSLPVDSLKLICIVPFDLFIPILTFVFGEAQLNGAVAIVSTARLEQRFYGMPDNHLLLHRRLIKEMKHELGHTFGLLHCKDRACIMSLANNIADVDKKGLTFCESCSNVLHNAIINIKGHSTK